MPQEPNLSATLQNPFQLFGTETGKVTPYHPVRNGVYLLQEDGTIKNIPVWMRLIGDQKQRLNTSYARQYLSKKGDGFITDGELNWETWMLNMHEILVLPDPPEGSKPTLAFPSPLTLVSSKGVVSQTDMDVLPLRKLADGELKRLMQEYKLFLKIQLPPYPTHEQMQQMIDEGKTDALKTLHSRHGSSALIQVLHGLGEGPWPM